MTEERIEFTTTIVNRGASFYVLIPAKILKKTDLLQEDVVKIQLEKVAL